MRARGLDLELDGPLIAAWGGLEKTSGFAEVVAALPDLVGTRANVVVAGTGAPGIVKALSASRYDKLPNYTFIGKGDVRTERGLLAAADLVLCPNPLDQTGGLPRKAQRYGALPVAYYGSAVRDVVVDCDAQLSSGTGFLFDTPSASSMMGAVARGLSAYQSSDWDRLVKRVMGLDGSWDRPARRYAQLYRGMLKAVSSAA